MTRDQIIAQVRPIIAEHLGRVPEAITEAAVFEDLGGDSFDRVEISIAVQEAFQIPIPDEDMDDLTSLGALADYVTARLTKEIA